MATHIITFPGVPATLNSLLVHWAERGRLKRLDRQVIYFAAREAGVPRATGRRRVSLDMTGWPRGKMPDPDAFWKSTLDALVAAGMLVDDDSKGVQLGTVTMSRGVPRTLITLEDL